MAKRISNDQLESIKTQYPNLRESTIIDSYDNYKTLIMDEIITNAIWRDNYNSGQFAATAISNELGKLGGTKIRATKIFEQHCNLVELPRHVSDGKGSNRTREISKNVKFNIPMSEVYTHIMDTNVLSLMKNMDEHLTKATESDDFNITIDMDSLRAYISKTTDLIETLSNKNQIEHYHRSLVYAQVILQVAGQFNGVLPQYAEVKNTGRLYYQGVNLQNCPKVVRYAALGNCTQFDFRANSYAILLELAIKICVNAGAYTRDELVEMWSMIPIYIKDRASVRNQIATDVFGVADDYAIKKIKTAFTMFGFGAQAVNNPHTAIAKAIGNKEHTDKFLNNFMFKKLYTQFTQVCDIVFKECEDNGAILDVMAHEESECDKKGFDLINFNKKLEQYANYNSDKPLRTKAFYGKTLAFAYQSEEALLMKAFVEMLQHDGEVLWLHDGVVVRGYRGHTWKDAIHNIQSLYPFVSIDREEVFGWVDNRNSDAEELARVTAHKNMIAEQERIAADYVARNTHIQTDTVVESKEQRELTAYCEFMGISKKDMAHVSDALRDVDATRH